MQEIFFTAFVLLLSTIYTVNALGVRIGTFQAPGPGFLPIIIGFGAIAIATFILVDKLIRLKQHKVVNLVAEQNVEEQAAAVDENINIKRTIQFILGTVAYIVLLRPLGFVLTSVIIMFYLFYIMGIKGLVRQIIYALLSASVAYLIFVNWLGVPFPKGIFM